MAGTWDCYCAICAGPMFGVSIRRRDPDRQRQNDNPQDASKNGNDADTTIKDSPEEYEMGENESDDEDDDGYNPTVLQSGDIGWTEDCRFLAFDSYKHRALMSGAGRYENYGGMECAPGTDPDWDDAYLAAMSCYTVTSINNEDQEPAIPFHWDCYKLLCRCLTGSDDVDLIDKDIFFRVSSPLSAACRLDINYNEPGTGLEIACDQTWTHNRGEELYVCSPSSTARLSASIRSDFNRSVTMRGLDGSLGSKAQSDPFARLPLDIVDRILSFVDDSSLINLFNASWCVHVAYHDNNNFWRRRIKSHLDWFFELHDYIDSEDSCSIISMKAVYLRSLMMTKPRLGLRGTYMWIANRRRIWGVCRHLVELYLQESSAKDPDIEDVVQRKTPRPMAGCGSASNQSESSPAGYWALCSRWLASWF